jgi:putative ABC transport system substrate-binding protein
MTRLTQLKQHLKAAAFTLSLIIPTVSHADKTIAITQIVDHPSLNQIREGIIEGLASKGYVEGKNLKVIYENAQGNTSIAAQIAQKFAGMNPDVIIPISTPSAQSVVKNTKTIPVIFAGITDPVDAKVVTSLERPGGNVSGVADIPPLKEQVEFMETCVSHLKTVGVIYNPGEANSVSFFEQLKPILKQKNIKLITAAAPKSSDVKAAATSIIGKVDAIFVGNDNTVISGIASLIQACLEANKPLFVSDPDSVERGAYAAYAYDQKEMGRQTGEMVAEVLEGKNPGDIPVERPHGLKRIINPKVAEKLRLTCGIVE